MLGEKPLRHITNMACPLMDSVNTSIRCPRIRHWAPATTLPASKSTLVPDSTGARQLRLYPQTKNQIEVYHQAETSQIYPHVMLWMYPVIILLVGIQPTTNDTNLHKNNNIN
jgi:hypothetical protein